MKSGKKEEKMRNKARLVAAIVVAGLFVSCQAYAASDTAANTTGEKKPAVVDVGNKRCPVTGEEVDGKTFYEYNGKRYGFCCPMCIATFEKNPVKYSGIAEKEAEGKK